MPFPTTMPRVSIDLPRRFAFATEIPVCIGHIDDRIVCFDYGARKAVPMPPTFREKVAA